jgi:hypothetical protein
MDLLRRAAAGELSELLGPAALDLDRRHRLHRFRNRALTALAAAPADERRLIELYTRGVNDGLRALSIRPFEYLLLRMTPSSWRPEDSALVAYAMYLDLQYRELESTVARAILRERVTDDMFALLLPNASHWDAPLDQATSPTVDMPGLPTTKPDWIGSLAPPTTRRCDSGQQWLGGRRPARQPWRDAVITTPASMDVARRFMSSSQRPRPREQTDMKWIYAHPDATAAVKFTRPCHVPSAGRNRSIQRSPGGMEGAATSGCGPRQPTWSR